MTAGISRAGLHDTSRNLRPSSLTCGQPRANHSAMTGYDKAEALPDAPARNWLDRMAPTWLLPYGRLARWDRPIGWWLLLLPCWWSTALVAEIAGRAVPDPGHLALFLIGAIAMRGAGCTYNDIVDRGIDRQVERTRSRPIPSGAVSVRRASLFLAAQALVGLIVLVQFNRFTIGLGLAALVPVAVYPFMKRFTDWPQLFLGFAFSWGALVGWTASTGSLTAAPITLYLASIAWTIAYDTIYALQDIEDDALIGVRSTARLFGARVKPALGIFFGTAALLMGLSVWLAGRGLPAYLGIAVAAAHFTWQVRTLDAGDEANCLQRFRSNRDAGLIVFLFWAFDAAL